MTDMPNSDDLTLAPPEDWPTLVDMLRARVGECSERVSYTFLGDRDNAETHLTYGELDKRARAIAAHLRERDVQRAPVLLLYAPGLDYIAGLFGCLYAGALAVPAYPPLNARQAVRLQRIAKDAGANHLLSTKLVIGMATAFNERAKSRQDDSSFSADLHWIATDDPQVVTGGSWINPAIAPGDLAFLQYTSGSTSAPKGVMLTHRNLMHNLRSIEHLFGLRPGTPSVSWLPPYHDMGLIGQVLEPVFMGAHTHLMSPAAFLQSPMRWLETISRTRSEVSGGPNFAYDLAARKAQPADIDNLDLSCWRLAFNGAEPIRGETLDRFVETFGRCGFDRKAFYPCYGMAEGTLILSGGVHDTLPVEGTFDTEALGKGRAVAASDLSRRLVSSGRPTPEHRIAIVDPETLARCPDATVGEIWVAGPSIAAGYWRKTELSNQSFHAAIAGGDPGPFLRTGDLGFVVEGELFVVGRLKDLIILRGRNLYPDDVELSVSSCHPDLRPGCVAAFSIEHESEEHLVVVQEVVRRPSASHDEIIAAIRGVVAAEHSVEVHAIVLLQIGSIPKTSSGKIQRYVCRDGFLARELKEVARWVRPERPAQAPPNIVAELPAGLANPASPDRDCIEQWLLGWVARTAGIAAASISSTEPLAQFGLGSRDMVGLTDDLEQWLGCRLSPVLAYQYPTIKALAEHLATGRVEPGDGHQARAAASESEPIAIVGLSCRFPGAADPDAFWGMLANAVDAVSERPERWTTDGTAARGVTQMSTMAGGFLDEVGTFDAEFFGISPREAVHMDPQQRVLLEVAWEALERAGALGATGSINRTGVFIGISSNDYAQLMVRGGATIDAYVGTGTALSIAANRLSYQLDLRGPSLAVDTACSSSLVAVHLAVRSLRRGECDAALAGGVNLLLSPDPSLAFSHARMMAPRGRCRTFDAGADGYVRGEGCGVLVLKRLSDALANHDHVIAVIRGSATNQDGRSNGLTAPNGLAQQAVIRDALSDAGLSASDLDYIETHGTGTPLGDPIEVEALTAVLLHDRPADRRFALGSVKTNIGHLEAAAGIAGLIKTALAIEHGLVPAHLHLEQLNPAISLEGTPCFIARETSPWPTTTAPRRAGVSSFGFGGTNCHVILEQAPATEPRPELSERPRHILSLSARTSEALASLAGKFAEAVRLDRGASLADVCFTANTGRPHHEVRLATSASSVDELAGALSAFAAGEGPAAVDTGRVEDRDRNRVVFLFTGQGSQYPGMGRELYETEPRFRQELIRCEEILRDQLAEPLISVMYGGSSKLLNETAYTQTALFALEWSLAALWRSWGVEPRAVIGHSIGEYVAGCVAGVFDLEDALKLVAARGRLMQALPRDGAMASLRCRPDVALDALAPFAAEVSIAAVNGPDDVVISGRSEAVKLVCAELETQGVPAQLLNVSHAFHSPLMEPMLDEFEAVAQQLTYRSPTLELISNVTGARAGDDVCSAAYWRRHVREAVMFSGGLDSLRGAGYSTFLELGPAPILTALGRRQAVDGETWQWSLRQNRSDWSQMLASLGRLYVRGASVSWPGFDTGRYRRRVPLPTYAFERQRFWFKPAAVKRVQRHPFLGRRTQPDPSPDIRFLGDVSRELAPMLADHRVSGTAVFPTTGYIEIALAGASELLGPGPYVLEDLLILRPLVVGETAGQQVSLTVSPASTSGSCDFTIAAASAAHGANAERYAVGRIAAVPGEVAAQVETPERARARMKHIMSRDEFYGALTANGLDYGEAFRGVEAVWLGDGEALGRIVLPEILDRENERYELHPVMLDSCFQLLGAAAVDRATKGTYVPVGVHRLIVYRRPENALWGHAQLRASGGSPEAAIESLEGDLQLFDDAGIVVASVVGLSLRRASAAQLQSMRQPLRLGPAPLVLPWLGTPMPAVAELRGTYHWERELDPNALEFPGIYREGGATVLPLAVFAEMALAAAAQAYPGDGWGFSSVDIHQPLMLGKAERRVMQVSLANAAAGATVRVYTRPIEAESLGAGWALHATATLRPEKPAMSNGRSGMSMRSQ
jgi:acyl transferase domain-containing protein/acyl-CoA synthetase (AMP-forming)/AMP-acid ligase II/acyl carrier protein